MTDLVELHCHLDQVLSPAQAAALGLDLGDLVPVTRATWPRYQALVAPVYKQHAVAIAEHHARSLVAQGCVHAELMVAGLLDPHGDVGPVRERFRAIREVATASGISIAVLVAIARGARGKLERQVARIHELGDLVDGVALAGDEAACTVASIADLIAGLRDAGLGIEIHAGETLGAASVWDALPHADRLGHAIAAFGDPALLDQIRERGIHVELCPTSNLRLGVVARLEDHPLARIRELGISFSINTDDPGAFGCTLASEYALARGLGFTDADVARIRDHGLAARFPLH